MTLEVKAVCKVGEVWVGHGERTGRTKEWKEGEGSQCSVVKGSVMPEKGSIWGTG